MTLPAQTNLKCAGNGALRLSGIRVVVSGSVATPCFKRSYRTRIFYKSGGGNAQGRQSRGKKIGNVIQPRSYFAKVKVSIVCMTDHRVERVDRLVGHCEWNPSDRHIKERRDDTIRATFCDGFDHRAANLLFGQRLSIAADNS